MSRRGLGLGLGLAGVGLAVLWSLGAGVADLLGWQAERVVATVPRGRLPPGSPADIAVRDLLAWAHRLDPLNPAYTQRQGQRLERSALLSAPRSPVERAYLTQARERYGRAAALRPTWPLSLLPILRTDLKLERLGPGFGRMYRRACALGAAEPAALRGLTDLGLVAWPLLDGDGQGAVSSLLAQGLRLVPRQTIERAVALQRGPAIAPLVSADPGLAALYRDALARAPRGP